MTPRGEVYPPRSFCHTGFTGFSGCVLWIDPGSRSVYGFLSKRVYPNGASRVLAPYTRIGTLAPQAAFFNVELFPAGYRAHPLWRPLYTLPPQFIFLILLSFMPQID
jgi:hypothetical protein